MRKIVCQACDNRHGGYGLWIVYDSVIICEGCRLATIRWFREEFDLGHPFVQEFILMSRNKK